MNSRKKKVKKQEKVPHGCVEGRPVEEEVRENVHQETHIRKP